MKAMKMYQPGTRVIHDPCQDGHLLGYDFNTLAVSAVDAYTLSIAVSYDNA